MFPSHDRHDKNAILYRSYSQLIGGEYQVLEKDTSLRDYIKAALQTPQDHISGIFIFNMAKTTAQVESDYLDSNSVEVGRIYNDYFSTDLKAAEAWQKTIWYRLGFNYETFNTISSNKLASYYLNPVSTSTNITNSRTSQSAYFNTQNADRLLTVKSRNRQVLCSLLSDGSVFNDVSDAIDDNYLPGITTGAKLNTLAISSIASAPGVTEGEDNQLVRLYNNASLSTVRSMTRGS